MESRWQVDIGSGRWQALHRIASSCIHITKRIKTDVVGIPSFMPGIMTKDKLHTGLLRRIVIDNLKVEEGTLQYYYMNTLFIAFHEFNLS